ncbi:vesicle-associated membrane protein 3-like [Asterias rubens]|uniref:vesicle-associated membrane protein 3-like n=1 Tax=Asterias rubens TaxID=7604 RepID=UPI0014554405|nr:vesicle-associated membrane protein 3-like [Asterias rubens]
MEIILLQQSRSFRYEFIMYGSRGGNNKARYDDQQGEDAKSQAEQKRVKKLQAEVDEVAVILHTTVDKLLERGEKLDDLMDGADNLLEQASSFKTTAKKVKTHYKWKNKMLAVAGVVVVLVIIGLIVLFILRPWETHD